VFGKFHRNQAPHLQLSDVRALLQVLRRCNNNDKRLRYLRTYQPILYKFLNAETEDKGHMDRQLLVLHSIEGQATSTYQLHAEYIRQLRALYRYLQYER